MENNQELIKAFIAFQKEKPKIPFNSKVSYGKTEFEYADLASILDTCLPVLHKHGLAITQLVNEGRITTILMHESGQCMSSDTLYSTQGKPQDQGSQITYMKRYALSAMLGIAAEEDKDGAQSAPAPVSKKKPWAQAAIEQFAAEIKTCNKGTITGLKQTYRENKSLIAQKYHARLEELISLKEKE